MRNYLAAAAVVLSMSSASFAQQATTAQDFTAMAASSDMFEIRSSELAQQKGSSAEVKEFAAMMIADHTKASQNLAAAAQQAGTTVPAEMMPKHASKLAALNDLSGKAFDDAYIDAQEEAHEEALALMTGYAENGDSAPLKAHAAATAPVIQMHHEHVEKMDD